MDLHPIYSNYVFNYVKQEKDSRDFKFHKTFDLKGEKDLPTSFNLSSFAPLPGVLDQGKLGSCTANSTSNALRHSLKINHLWEFQPSRLFIYYFTREIEGTTGSDAGASLRNTMKAVSKKGACTEYTWGYDPAVLTTKPSSLAVTEGKAHKKGFKYYSINRDLVTMKNALVSGFPIVIGIAVYQSFVSNAVAKTGTVPLPNKNSEKLLGGHAILMVGYDDASQRFTFMNSWGTGWGANGYFTLPYNYVMDKSLAMDMWAIQSFK